MSETAHPPLRILNSLTREKEAFEPLEPGKVRLYVCGVTVYSSSHIGHARSGVSFDIVVRHLLHRGLDVTFVKNFTDVDDKIIKRAQEEGVDASEVSERYIAEFHRDMDALHILRPDHEPKVTGFMPQILAMIQTLIDRGHAYEAEGDVFFDVTSKADYGKLTGRHLEEQEEGARIEVDPRKKNPFDFVLWKAAKPGEPAWESPWGQGRPGWHIECSAMGTELLGEQFDIHGGGSDLLFPHHENEIAQSEGATGVVPWVKTWMHNGMITIDREKMSKSLGNFFTIQEVLSLYHPEAVRMFFLSAHYRSPVDFSQEAIHEAEGRLERLYGTLAELDRQLGDTVPRPQPDSDGGWRRHHLHDAPDPLEGFDETQLQGADRGLHANLVKLLPQVDEAMDDDFNSAKALGHVFDVVRKVNRWLDGEPDLVDAQVRTLAEAARDRLLRLGARFGLFHEEPASFFSNLRARRLSYVGMNEAEIDQAITERNAARQAKDYARSDEIRDGLLAKGVELHDGPEGTTWTVKAQV